jgi:uncharacterized protein
VNLNAIEQRVLGALLEKSLATPNLYPLTLNSLTLACNQQTSREPVTNYDEALVEATLEELREKRMVVKHLGARADKFSQTLSLMADVSREELALLAVLMLRGAQTVGDLRQRAERMAEFADLSAAQTALSSLCNRNPAMARMLERRAGEKEARYVHALGEVHVPLVSEAEHAPAQTPTQARLDAIEAELVALKLEFAAFKKQFE